MRPRRGRMGAPAQGEPFAGDSEPSGGESSRDLHGAVRERQPGVIERCLIVCPSSLVITSHPSLRLLPCRRAVGGRTPLARENGRRGSPECPRE